MRSTGLCLLLLLTGCPSSPGNNGDMPVADLGAGGDFARPQRDMSGPCGSDNKIPDGGVCLVSVSGTLLDEATKPVPDLVTSVCAGVCYFGKTVNDGSFTVLVDHYVFPDQFAFEVHGRPDLLNYYTALPPIMNNEAKYAAPLPLVPLPKMGPLIALDNSAQSLTSGDVTLILDAGTEVLLDVEDVQAGDPGRMFRAYTAPDPSKLPFVDSNALPDALYGFAPFEVIFSKGKAHFSFANTGKFAPGTAFDVLAQSGLLDSPVTYPAGRWVPVATAKVSMDGMKIDTDAGTGVTTLTWIALRKK